MKKWAKYVELALIIINFLRKLEPIVDPEEKTTIDDVVLEVLDEIGKKLAAE